MVEEHFGPYKEGTTPQKPGITAPPFLGAHVYSEPLRIEREKLFWGGERLGNIILWFAMVGQPLVNVFECHYARMTPKAKIMGRGWEASTLPYR